MKNKGNDYTLFKRKISLRIFGTLLGAGVVVFIIQLLARGYIGEWVVDTLIERVGLDYESAFRVHHILIRGNISVFNIIMMAGALLLVFRIFSNYVTKYFDELSVGLDGLIDGEEKDCQFSPEIQSLEIKVNQVKHMLVKREREAKEAEQRKNDLVVYLAHDIRTPLTSVIGYLTLLEEMKDLPREQQRRYLKLTLDKSYRLEGLINEFFDITRFNLQEVIVNKEPLDIRLLVEQVVDEFSLIAIETGKKIEITGEEHLFLSADPDKIGRVFTNLMKNGLAYSPEGATLSIDVSHEDGKGIVIFTNKGKVIPKEMLEAIFDKFYRLDNARSSQTGGSGLGLAIAKEIVEAHGGKIWGESSEAATNFIVSLPLDKK